MHEVNVVYEIALLVRGEDVIRELVPPLLYVVHVSGIAMRSLIKSPSKSSKVSQVNLIIRVLNIFVRSYRRLLLLGHKTRFG